MLKIFSMHISKKIIWFGLRACLYCGALDRRTDGLCKICSEDLWAWQNADNELFFQRVHKLEVFSLFQWVPGRQEVLSRLVHALKGTSGDELWDTYAEEFHRRMIPEQVVHRQKPLLIIPCPGKLKTRDHASLFARALAAETGGEVYNCLLREKSVDQQKNKSRSQRGRISFDWSENFTMEDFLNKAMDRRLVFVDDVVTTGSTARGAWETLGRPRDFSVWALAQRALSCRGSKCLV